MRFESSDWTRTGAYSCAREQGVVVPGELSFVGFSDAPALRWWGDGLTSIALPVEDIATAAMDCLLRRAEQRDGVAERPMHVMHRPVLIVRGTAAAPPRSRPGSSQRTAAKRPIAA